MKHRINNSAKNIATIITVPHLTSDGGISPNRLRTFSERNSMSEEVFLLELVILFFYYFFKITPISGIPIQLSSSLGNEKRASLYFRNYSDFKRFQPFKMEA